MRKVLATAVVCIAVVSGVFIGHSSARADIALVEPEIVTGSRVYTDLFDIPAPTYVITAEEIDQSGATDLGALLEQKVPGITLKKKSGVAQESQLWLRGFTNQVLVLNDGIPLYRSSIGADFGTVDFRTFPLENIERVEVVKGGGSALYGSMAAGGVLNIITKKPEKSDGMILAEAGSNDWRRYYVSGNAVGDDLSAGIWYERIEEGRRRLLYDTVPENRFDSLGYKGDGYGLVLRGNRWVFRATTGENRYKYLTPGFPSGADLNDEKKEYGRYSFRYDAESLYLLTGYDTQKYDILTGEGNYYKDSAFTTEFGGRTILGDALAAWGLFYRSEKTEFFDGGDSAVVSRSRYNVAPFVEVSYPVGDWLVDLGLRYEVWRQENNDHEELIPKVSLLRQGAEGNMFYISASRVFAMPTFYELYADSYFPKFSYKVKGNPDLKPEKGWSYEAGLKIPGVNSWHIGVFYTVLDDKIKDKFGSPSTYINLAEFRSYGIEASKKWRLGPRWVLGLSGTWQVPEERVDILSGWARSDGIPGWEVGGSLEYRDGPWTAELSLNWAGDQGGDQEDYFIVDLGVSWRSGEDSITLSLSNLFDESYTFNSNGWFFYGPERGFRLSWERRF